MVQRKTNRGEPIDFDALMAQQGDRPAIGNMGVDAKGNKLGPGGVIVQSNEDRVRKYLKDNPVVSKDKVSLKNEQVATQTDFNAAPMQDVKTAKTAAENVRTSKLKPDPEPAVEPDEFAEPEEVPPLEPLGYKEVMMPNGDIEMVPYYDNDDNN